MISGNGFILIFMVFQFYNINNKKEKGNKYLNDIPFLIEDFFEIQKMAKFSIFDE